METTSTSIQLWCKEMISGPAGFLSFEEHEWPMWTIPREQAIAEFIIRCLANPDNKGSDYVIKSIVARREHKGEIKER